jgi:predicted glycosyltransferase
MVHLADVNFYKNALNELNKRHDITITVLNRGNLLKVITREYPDFKIVPLGKHYKGKLGKIIGLAQRSFGFLSQYLKDKPDVVTSFGFYPGVIAKPFGIPAVLFHDDYEYQFIFNMCNRFATNFFIPDSIRTKLPANLQGSNNDPTNKIQFYNGFKETAYLKNFQADASCLSRHDLVGKPFVFCRDIDSISLNYDDYELIDLAPAFQKLKDQGYTILYYPEKDHDRYNHLVTKLLGGIPDIMHLQYFASLTISSGDTIARESALVGTPVIYVGGRQMAVNLPLEEMGLIFSTENKEEVLNYVNKLLQPSFKSKMKEKIDAAGWEDITKVITNALEQHEPKKSKARQTVG